MSSPVRRLRSKSPFTVPTFGIVSGLNALLEWWLPDSVEGDDLRRRGRLLLGGCAAFILLVLDIQALYHWLGVPLGVPDNVPLLLLAATLVVPLGLRLTGAVRPLTLYWLGVLLLGAAIALLAGTEGARSHMLFALPVLPVLAAALAGRLAASAMGMCCALLLLAVHLRSEAEWIPGLVTAGLMALFTAVLGVLTEHLRERALDRVSQSERGFRRLAEHAADVVFRLRLTPEPKVEYLNPAGTRVLGHPLEELHNQGAKLLDTLTVLGDPQGEPRSLEATPTEQSALARWTAPDGRKVWLESRYGVFTDPDGSLVVEGIARDVTSQKRVEQALWHDANHDVLTGLPNRAQLQRHLSAAIEDSRTLGIDSALLYLDLDGFKQVNDNLGHEAGDTLLKAVAGRLAHTLRDCDPAFRVGGDEFAVLITEATSPDAVRAVARRILATLDRPFTLGDHRTEIGASIGVAYCPHDGQDPDELMRKADAAMYIAKKGGGGRWSTHSDIRQLRPSQPSLDQESQTGRRRASRP